MYRIKFMLGISLLALHAIDSIEQYHSTPTPPPPPFPFLSFCTFMPVLMIRSSLVRHYFAFCSLMHARLCSHLVHIYQIHTLKTIDFQLSALSCRQKVAYKLVYVFFCYRSRKLQIYRFFI